MAPPVVLSSGGRFQFRSLLNALRLALPCVVSAGLGCAISSAWWWWWGWRHCRDDSANNIAVPRTQSVKKSSPSSASKAEAGSSRKFEQFAQTGREAHPEKPVTRSRNSASAMMEGSQSGAEPQREIIQADALEWLRGENAVPSNAFVFTSLPDECEVMEVAPTRKDWEAWFEEAAARVLEALPLNGAVVFYQTDTRDDRGQVYCTRQVREFEVPDYVGIRLYILGVRICQALPGRCSTHTFCASRERFMQAQLEI